MVVPSNSRLLRVPPVYRESAQARRIELISTSFERLLGRPLPGDGPAGRDIVASLWHAGQAVVAHGMEEDPLFFFGNRAALEAFEYDVEQFVGMPSRLSVKAPLRSERQALLERVSADGFIADYAGARITATGRRFRIEGAIVWNLTEENGICHGQAAAFQLRMGLLR